MMLRGVNQNPGADPEGMVPVRISKCRSAMMMSRLHYCVPGRSCGYPSR